MRYFLPNSDLSNFPKLFVGGRQRYATATAACFIDDSIILISSLLEKKIYLIKLYLDNYEILDEIVIDGYVDLMDYKDGLLITSNQPAYEEKYGSLCLLEISNYKFNYIKKIELIGFTPHSVRIVDDNNFIFANTKDTNVGLYFYNLQNGIIKKFSNFEFYPKDIHIFNDKFLLITSKSKPNKNGVVEIKNSKLYLFEMQTLSKINEVEFFGQTDAVTLNNQDGFITIQNQDEILHFKLINNKLEIIKNIGGFDFPHGIASKGDKVIVTNYGNNSFDVLSINEMVN